MEIMKSVPIIGKVLLIIALFGAVSIFSAFFSATQIGRIADGYSAAIDQQGTAALYAARANRTLTAMRSNIAELQISTTAEQNQRALTDFKAARADFIRFVDMADQADPSGSLNLKGVKAKALDIVDLTCKKAIDMGAAALSIETLVPAQAEFLRSCSPALQLYAKLMTGVVDAAVLKQNAAKTELGSLGSLTVAITYTVALGSLAVVSLISFFAVRTWVSRPIQDLAGTMRRLADGDLTVDISNTNRRDEIGLMAGTVQVFKDTGLKARQLATEAAAMREAAAATQTRTQAEQAARAAEQAQVVDALAAGLARLSAGDLLFRVDRAFAHDYEALRSDFNGAMLKLQDTMKLVANNTTAIRSGSSEISSAADDLSRRTEQQAASLEETAAALDEITTTVRKTSEGAKHALVVVAAAKSGAEYSGDVMRQAVKAMTAIETSAREISQIIGVIDEIAFQTNLLALNAGVEAARAGDAGRGFAVVASEVRALAQRSAEAAKEIKTLISASSRQVAEGVQLVDQTGKALDQIVMQVGEMTGIVGDIAASTQEQATALNQVNTAINQMDQVTQQNAAMVEQSTAASHNLTQETEGLAEIVATFQVGQDGVRGAGTGGRSASVVTLKSVGRGGAARRPEAPALDDAWTNF